MKKFILILSLFASLGSFAQDLGQFKYIVLPERYENFKHDNQYQLNTLSKYMFESLGFTVVNEKENIPVDLATNPCLALKPSLEVDSNMFSTKIKIILKDCYNKVVFITEEGICRKEKDNRLSHQMAFREAAKSFGNLNLANDHTTISSAVVDVEKTAQKPVEKIVSNSFEEVLYAQPIGDGFQLIDSTPSVIMKLTKTSSPDIFLVHYKGYEGVLLKKNNQWIFEYQANGVLNSHPLNVKF